MADTGFQGRRLAETVRVWEQMILDPDVTIALGYAGSLSTTGQWKLITWLLENRYVDILVATGANLSEDIVEAMGHSYWKGSPLADDVELLNNDVNRYYDVYGSEIDYMEMTELIAQFYLEDLTSGVAYSSREILYRFGLWLSAKGIDSIVAVAAKAGVPVFCPAIVDSPYGDAGLIAKSKGFNLVIDNMKDYTEFMGVGERVKDTGVVYIGGGVPKDFIQLLAVTSNLLYQERVIPNRAPSVLRARRGDQDEMVETYYPHKYAVQVTTDVPPLGRPLRLHLRRSHQLGQGADQRAQGPVLLRRYHRPAPDHPRPQRAHHPEAHRHRLRLALRLSGGARTAAWRSAARPASTARGARRPRRLEVVAVREVPSVVADQRVLVRVLGLQAQHALGLLDRDERVLGGRLVDPLVERRERAAPPARAASRWPARPAGRRSSCRSPASSSTAW